MFCKLFSGYTPGGGTSDTTIPFGLYFRLPPEYVLLLESSNCVFFVFPLDRFAVTDPDTSRSLTNSVAASVFPSGNCHKDNKPKRPNFISSSSISVFLYTSISFFFLIRLSSPVGNCHFKQES